MNLENMLSEKMDIKYQMLFRLHEMSRTGTFIALSGFLGLREMGENERQELRGAGFLFGENISESCSGDSYTSL